MPDLSITNDGRLPDLNADPGQRLKRVCSQFEQAFVEMILKREDQDEDPLLDGDPAAKQYRDLLNTGLSEKIAGNLGIADVLLRELGTKAAINGPPLASGSSGGKP